MGPQAYGAKEEEIFLGREITRTKNYSESTAVAIDEEVKVIINVGMKRSELILRENIDILHRLAAALLEREILDGEEIDKVIRGEVLPPPVQKRNGQPVQSPAGAPPVEGGAK
jgi:cell division protease FtsH